MVAEARDERKTYDVAEIAAFLGVSRNHAYELAREGAFPSHRLGRRIGIPRQAFDRWLESAGQPEHAA